MSNIAFYDANLEEIAKYKPELITPDVLVDLMSELQAWRNCVDRHYVESPEEAAAYVNDLEEKAFGCNSEAHAKFDYYKEFFEDCVNALEENSGRWPCAEPYDNNLRAVICGAITRGSFEAENDQ